MKIKNKKGVLGLNTVQAVVIAFLIISVLAIAVILSLISLGSVEIGGTQIRFDALDASEWNGSVGLVTNASAGGNATANASLSGYNLVTSTLLCYNGTGGELIGSANFTSNSNGTLISTDTQCTDVLGGVSPSYCGWEWICTGDATYEVTSGSGHIIRNISTGTESFMASAPTIFAILVVVVIILAIAIIIAVVTRFGSGGGTNL